MVFHSERFDRARFPAQHFVRSLLRAAKIHNTVNTLLQRTHATITDVRAIVVVAEENGAGHEILRANGRVVGAQNFDPTLVTFGSVFSTSAVSVLGNDHRLTGKCGVKVIQMLGHCFWRPRSPASEIFICFNEVHQSSCITYWSLAQGV